MTFITKLRLNTEPSTFVENLSGALSRIVGSDILIFIFKYLCLLILI